MMMTSITGKLKKCNLTNQLVSLLQPLGDFYIPSQRSTSEYDLGTCAVLGKEVI